MLNVRAWSVGVIRGHIFATYSKLLSQRPRVWSRITTLLGLLP
jgi:hypothetical protein